MVKWCQEKSCVHSKFACLAHFTKEINDLDGHLQCFSVFLSSYTVNFLHYYHSLGRKHFFGKWHECDSLAYRSEFCYFKPKTILYFFNRILLNILETVWICVWEIYIYIYIYFWNLHVYGPVYMHVCVHAHIYWKEFLNLPYWYKPLTCMVWLNYSCQVYYLLFSPAVSMYNCMVLRTWMTHHKASWKNKGQMCFYVFFWGLLGWEPIQLISESHLRGRFFASLEYLSPNPYPLNHQKDGMHTL
jgi:hypothetical protein